MAIRSTGSILDYSFEALLEEEDLQLGEQAAAGNLKILEGLIKGDPHNPHLLILASRGFFSYALAFVEDIDSDRAGNLYRRAVKYGDRALEERYSLSLLSIQSLDRFKSIIDKFDTDDLEAMFWTATSWSSWINLNLNNPAALADLPKVEVLMLKILELDETFYYGGANLFFGVYYGSRPPPLGGDPGKARNYFERCIKISGGNFLMHYVYYARYYAVQTQNQDLFSELLEKVVNASLDILPEQRLVNAVAKKKAAKLLSEKENLFY